jgi:hypothetical protein
MRFLPLRQAAILSLSAILGCAATPDDARGQESESVDPNNSNIRSPEIGRVTELKLLPNTNVPRAVFVQLTSATFVADLYDHIRTINEAEGLSGAEGYNQQINLIVAATKSQYSSLLTRIRQRRGLVAGATVPLINLVENVSDDDMWMQDFGEFVAVRGQTDPSKRWYGVFDAGRGRGIDVEELGRLLGVSVTRLSGNFDNGGNYGGNTESTAEGILYVGDHATKGFINGLKALGNPNAVVLPSDWLDVGHVDEYLQVVPADNECHAAQMVASPLEALNMARHDPASFKSVQPGIGEALDAFAKNPRPQSEDYELSDFDLTRPASGGAARFVKQNLNAENFARIAIERLKAGACVKQVIKLPQLYSGKSSTVSAAFPGTVNSLVLRNHAVVPDPFIDSVRVVVRQRYAEALGSEDNVHFINDLVYHENLGEVHCGTNTIRELNLQYRMPH